MLHGWEDIKQRVDIQKINNKIYDVLYFVRVRLVLKKNCCCWLINTIHFILKMTSAQVVESSDTNNSSFQKLPSPGRLHRTSYCYSWIQTIYYIDVL